MQRKLIANRQLLCADLFCWNVRISCDWAFILDLLVESLATGKSFDGHQLKQVRFEEEKKIIRAAKHKSMLSVIAISYCWWFVLTSSSNIVSELSREDIPQGS